ncbi:MAG: D-TA family PLP-dependent enzyme [Chloroflexi bacterium]|nr:D-TA family PLP-dependent enzyme [Chloroflexota bacterium]
MRIEELDTPSLVVDLDVMERNIARMAAYTARHGIALRPHTKTHKIPAIAKQQLAAGAKGITVAKLGEAEIMAANGLDDVFVAYPLVGDVKQSRCARLASQIRLRTSFDSIDVARGLSRHARDVGATVYVLVDLDTGNHRTGVQTMDDLVELAQRTADLPNLDLEGLFVYPGHLSHGSPNRAAELTAQREVVAEAVERLAVVGLRPRVVSSGNTPAAEHVHEIGNVTEMRPGTYVFNDSNTVATGYCSFDECAASVLVTVVSRPTADRAIVDGGSKTFTAEAPRAPRAGHGYVREYPEAVLVKMNEEHGFLDLSGCERQPRVGERVRIVPNHICCTVNQFEELAGVRGETVEVVWPVAARGKLK